MYRLAVPNDFVLSKFESIDHEQFRSSISTEWSVDEQGRMKPQSICWLFSWAANKDVKYQGALGYLRTLFDTIMPFSYAVFDEKVGIEASDRLRSKTDEAEVQAELESRLDRLEHDGPLCAELLKAADNEMEEGYFSPDYFKDERERKLQEVVHRRGQPEFRKRLISAYEGRCAISGCNALAALEAAHIVPNCGTESDRVVNGLLLRGDIHTLFDLDLIGIDPDSLKVVLANQLRGTCYEEFSGKPITILGDTAFRVSREALNHRWKTFNGEDVPHPVIEEDEEQEVEIYWVNRNGGYRGAVVASSQIIPGRFVYFSNIRGDFHSWRLRDFIGRKMLSSDHCTLNIFQIGDLVEVTSTDIPPDNADRIDVWENALRRQSEDEFGPIDENVTPELMPKLWKPLR